ncbi:hypothetical protein LGN19_05750 [Burkholderia sp. AU30198]|uniref:hypothetical protein n=1 Tax=Burkholderia sp. AU30198 TaxID=2879627 RepID=UPI001CF3A0BE|nr:hypothetical protein [Burkholderia sp. AU30198]MCA8293295.1 hypothetical protein [Burkholderia sp. AU30198]
MNDSQMLGRWWRTVVTDLRCRRVGAHGSYIATSSQFRGGCYGTFLLAAHRLSDLYIHEID